MGSASVEFFTQSLMDVQVTDFYRSIAAFESALLWALRHHDLVETAGAHGHEKGGLDHAVVESETKSPSEAFGLE